MNPEQLFEIWAPADSIWSLWAKPVLFAQGVQGVGSTPFTWRQYDVSWAPSSAEAAAIVLDVPGPLSVELGIALAAVGYRPVPLFNTCFGPQAVVDVQPICQALAAAAEVLETLTIDRDAPPVFLLDAARMCEDRSVIKPGVFDNRWLVFPQDFPSANFLQSNGIRSVLLVQNRRERPADDTAHILRRWQDAGIRILAKDLSAEATPVPIDVPRPRLYKAAWHRVLAALGFRRNSAGGFGAVVPVPSSSTG